MPCDVGITGDELDAGLVVDEVNHGHLLVCQFSRRCHGPRSTGSCGLRRSRRQGLHLQVNVPARRTHLPVLFCAVSVDVDRLINTSTTNDGILLDELDCPACLYWTLGRFYLALEETFGLLRVLDDENQGGSDGGVVEILAPCTVEEDHTQVGELFWNQHLGYDLFDLVWGQQKAPAFGYLAGLQALQDGRLQLQSLVQLLELRVHVVQYVQLVQPILLQRSHRLLVLGGDLVDGGLRNVGLALNFVVLLGVDLRDPSEVAQQELDLLVDDGDVVDVKVEQVVGARHAGRSVEEDREHLVGPLSAKVQSRGHHRQICVRDCQDLLVSRSLWDH